MKAVGNKQLGFSLVEIMSVVLLSGVLILVATPMVDAYSSQRDALHLQAHFHKSLAAAQEQALDTGDDVTVCTSNNGKTCTHSPWEQGWLVYSGSEPTPKVSAKVIETYLGQDPGARMTVIDGQRTSPGVIRFSSRGFVDERLVASFCQPESSDSRYLIVERTGRMRPIMKIDELQGQFNASVHDSCAATRAG